jgi:hypothetical protein
VRTESDSEKWTAYAVLPPHDLSFIRFTSLNVLLLILVFVFAFASGLAAAWMNLSVYTVTFLVFVLNSLILFIQAIFILVKLVRLIRQKQPGRGVKIIVLICFPAAMYPAFQISVMVLGVNDFLCGDQAIGG